MRDIETIVLVEVIPAFGDRKRHDPARGIGARIDERGKIGGPGQHPRDRADRLIRTLALRRDGLERVGTLLRGQRGECRVHVVANVPDRQRPALAGRHGRVGAMQIPRLVRTMERSGANMQQHWRTREGRPRHPCLLTAARRLK